MYKSGVLRAALYARVSTDEQVEGYSIEGQLETTAKHAEANGWSVVERYIDAGYSARSDNRPAFKSMIADAKAGKFDAVLVLRSDRFARNRMHSAMYKQLLRDVGVRVVSVSEPIEEGTPAGVILEGMNEVIAEWYSVDLSVKITDAKRRRWEKGLWNGLVPFGYVKGPAGLMVPVPEEAALVKEAFERYGSGHHTFAEIAAWLNSTGHKPRVHRKDRSGREYLWGKDGVDDMLANETYMGLVKYKGQTIKGNHPPILDERTFELVQRARRKRRRRPWTYTPRHRSYLLAGLLVCARCGTKLWCQHISGHDYYREETRRRGLPCTGIKTTVRAEVLDQQVAQVIKMLSLPDSWRQIVLDHLASSDQRQNATEELKRLKERRRRAYRAFLDGMPEDEYRREIAAIDAATAALQDFDDSEVISLGDNVEGLLAAWRSASRKERQQILTSMIDAVYVELEERAVVALQVKPPFKPLFRAWLDTGTQPGPVRVWFGDAKSRKHDLVHGDPERI